MNTRLWEAMRVLVAGHGGVRSRVADACGILDKINPKELSEQCANELRAILDEAGKLGSQMGSDGRHTKDRFHNTAWRRRNSTYEGLAMRIFRLYSEVGAQ